MLSDTERLLLMHTRNRPLPLEHLTRFAKIGVETAIVYSWTSWHEIEPEPGVYRWELLDEIVERHRQAGLKVLLPLYNRAPDWVEVAIDHEPVFGLVHDWDPIWGLSYRDIDPLDDDTLALELEFVERVCERYTTSDVHCMHGVPGCGDRILPLHYGKPYTEQQCIDLVLARQRLFAQYSDELWAAWHPAMVWGWTHPSGNVPEKCGNEYIDVCFEAMRDEFPDHTHNRIAHTYFGGGGPQWGVGVPWAKTWVGAEYMTGVVGHAAQLQRHKIWGMIMEYGSTDDLPTDEDYANVELALEKLREMP